MAGASDALRLPKIAVTVDLVQDDGGTPRTLEVFVAEHVEHGYRQQHVADLFEADTAFLPVRDPREGDVFLLNKASVIWVRISLDAGRLPVEERASAATSDEEVGELFDVAESIRVELGTRPALTGGILYTPRAADASRVLDYLNQPGRLFRLWTPGHLYLVNKQFVRRVIEIGPDGG
jgi:hypothetical protein